MRQDLPKYRSVQAGIPFIPAIGTATDLGTGSTVSVAFTGNNTGSITYTAISSPGNITATGASSPITVSGLTAGTAYTFRVNASDGTNTSAYSASSNSVTPVVPTSFDSIATVTGSGQTSITFSSITSSYKSLQIRILGRDNGPNFGASDINITFNSNSSGYAWHRLTGSGSSVSATSGTSQTSIPIQTALSAGGNSSGIFATTIIDIVDYASTSKNKTLRAISGLDLNNSQGSINLNSGLWANTSAISSLTISNGDGFATGTSVALYGIKG